MDDAILLILFCSVLHKPLKSVPKDSFGTTQHKLHNDLKLVTKKVIVNCISLNRKYYGCQNRSISITRLLFVG